MTTIQRRFTGWVQTLLLLAAVTLTGGAHWQAMAQEAYVDPPSRVARLSELNGQVWLYNPDSGEWLAASRNQPLTSGDRLATEAGARAELQIGSTTLRIDASSELEVVQLDDNRVALELHGGSAIAHVRDLNGAGQLELATDEGRFVALSAGTYRFDRRDGRSAITVASGQARYEGPNSGLPVNAGRRAEFWIDSGGLAQYSTTSPVNDAFVAWSNGRDRRIVGNVSERYVSPEMTGAAELDAYGRWEQTPDYGSVWIPTAVAADWAPYSQGRWTYVRPWGWTWIDDAPWGFAPFHYGRWVHVRDRWCWTPGTRVAQPVYAPALVGWIGSSRGNVSVTVGGGPAVGWFPLAPREVYVPSYRVSPRYARNVNITNVTNVTVITNVFRNPQDPREFENRRAPRGVTVVPSDVMAERRPVGPAAAQFRQAPWVRDFARERGPAPAMLAPPIVTPALQARAGDPRGVLPPPGARADTRERSPGFTNQTGTFPRDRNEAEQRDRDRRPPFVRERELEREIERGGFGQGQRQPGLSSQPGIDPSRSAEQNRPAPSFGRPAPAVQPQMPMQPGQPIINPSAAMQPPPGFNRPGFEPGRSFGSRDNLNDRPGENPRAPMVPPTAQPAGPAAVAPPPVQPQERPTMRALPIQRGDERGDGRRNDERRMDERRMEGRRPARSEAPSPQLAQPQPQLPQQQQQTQPPRFERPAMPMAPRAAEVQRPVAPVALPVAPPQAPRAEPRQEPQQRVQRTESRGEDQRGGGPREPR